MNHLEYINTCKWFAWRPVLTENSGIVWLTWVTKTVDERAEVYLGLLPETYYEL